MKLLWTSIEIWAALMALSAVMYCFAGLHFWAPLEVNQYGRVDDPARVMGLMLLHVMPIFAAIAHRASR